MELEVCQFVGGFDDSGILMDWVNDGKFEFDNSGEFMIIPTDNGSMKVNKGDYVIKLPLGGGYIGVKKEHFEFQYEEA